MLNDVQLEESGEISCEARNSVGSKKQLATLVVKPSGKAPFFEKNIQDKLVVEGEELIMDAKLAQVVENRNYYLIAFYSYFKSIKSSNNFISLQLFLVIYVEDVCKLDAFNE